jgi:ArsR family transcriptional regulator
MRDLATTMTVMSDPNPVAGPAAASCRPPSDGINGALDAARIAMVAGALGDPLRVQILDVIRRSDEEVCECELIALFHVRPSLLSYHLRKLGDAGRFEVERRHKWAHYSATDHPV